MKRLWMAASCLMIANASEAKAQPAFVTALSRPTNRMVLHGKDVPWVKVYEWEEGGKRFNAWPGDTMKVPPYAAQMRLQLFTFPTGALRHLMFVAGDKTPVHINMQDIAIYSQSGSQTETVNDISDIGSAGDASYHPVGVKHSSVTHTDAERDEFAFRPQAGGGDRAVFAKQVATPLRPFATLLKSGRVTVVSGAEAAMASAPSRYRARIFEFPNYTLHHVYYPVGYVLPLHENMAEQLVYVVKGHLSVTIGAIKDEVYSGDMHRMVAGADFAVAAKAPTELLMINATRTP